MSDDNLSRITVLNAASLATGTYTMPPISISDFKLKGNVTLQIEVTGGGTLETNYLVSNSYNKKDGTGDFVKAVSGYNIASLSTFTVGSGTDTDGKDHANVPLNNAEAFKLQFVVTSDSIVLSAWLSIQ